MNHSLRSDPTQRKWDILHTFCYAYICQPPQELWGDAEAMKERNELLELVGNSVHSTDWKSILTSKSKMRVITLSIKDAKEFYESEVIKDKTDAYKAIEEYFKRADWEREMLRSEMPPPESLLITYMKPGDKYFNPEVVVRKTKKTKEKAK